MTFRERRASCQLQRSGGCRRINKDSCSDGNESDSTSKTSSSHSSNDNNNSCCNNHKKEIVGRRRSVVTTYVMREKLFAFGLGNDDFTTIEKLEEDCNCRGDDGDDEATKEEFYFDNKTECGDNETFNIRSSPCGRVLYQVQKQNKSKGCHTMKMVDYYGNNIVEIKHKKSRFGGVFHRDSIVIKVRGNRKWQICDGGSISEHDFTIKEENSNGGENKLVAKIHKTKLVAPLEEERYLIDIEDPEHAAIVLMVAASLEEMSGCC